MKFPHWPEMKGYREIKFGLDRVYDLLTRLDNPHLLLPPTIHVAGTNGKGSNIAYLDAIFSDAGYKVHKYISPNLVQFNERITLAGKEISDEYLTEILNECKKAAEIAPKIEVTFFEGITVAAFLAFSRIKADILLLEVGMGGRLDATNVILDVIATIITPISNDHQEFLGNSLAKITREKAGIIKEGVPVIIGKQKPEALEILKNTAKEKNCPCYCLGQDWTLFEEDKNIHINIDDHKLELPLPALIGHHQLENATTAIVASLIQNDIEISDANLFNGLKKVKWPARLEKVKSGKLVNKLLKYFDIYLDGGHNENSAQAISNWLVKENMRVVKGGKKSPSTYLICAMLENKNIYRFLKYLAGNLDFVIGMKINNENKSKTAKQICKNALELGIKSVDVDDFEEAFKYIKTIDGVENSERSSLVRSFNPFKKINKSRILICGSLYFVGQFIEENAEEKK
jgi:dihydrofolate synthase/folylpolyglutamate synthase